LFNYYIEQLIRQEYIATARHTLCSRAPQSRTALVAIDKSGIISS